MIMKCDEVCSIGSLLVAAIMLVWGSHLEGSDSGPTGEVASSAVGVSFCTSISKLFESCLSKPVSLPATSALSVLQIKSLQLTTIDAHEHPADELNEIKIGHPARRVSNILAFQPEAV
jgi:hypothetical protein